MSRKHTWLHGDGIGKAIILLFCVFTGCALFLIAGCERQSTGKVTVDTALQDAIQQKRVFRFEHDEKIFLFTVVSNPRPYKFFGVGLVVKKKDMPSPKMVNPFEIVILTDEAQDLFKVFNYGVSFGVITSLRQFEQETDVEWRKKIVALARSMEKNSQPVIERVMSNIPMNLYFSMNGSLSSISAISTNVSSRALLNVLTVKKSEEGYFPDKPFIEYEVSKEQMPIVTVQDEERIVYPDSYPRIRYSPLQARSGSGYLTNRFVWAAENGYFEEFESNLNWYNEYDLCRIRMAGDNGKSLTVPMIYLAYLTSVNEYSNIIDVKKDRRLLNRLRDIRLSLDQAWEKRDIDDVYIRFTKRPPFIGYLKEYVPSYSFDQMLHLVVETKQGEYVLLSDPFEIEEVQTQTLVDAHTWYAYTKEVESDRKIKYPTKPILHFSSTQPVALNGEKSWAKNFRITLNKVLMNNTLYIPSMANPHTTVKTPAQDQIFVVIEGTITLPEGHERIQAFNHDEFRLYNPDGHFFQAKGFIELNGVANQCSVTEMIGSFRLVAMIPKTEPIIYFQFRDTPPVMVILTQTIPVEYLN